MFCVNLLRQDYSLTFGWPSDVWPRFSLLFADCAWVPRVIPSCQLIWTLIFSLSSTESNSAYTAGGKGDAVSSSFWENTEFLLLEALDVTDFMHVTHESLHIPGATVVRFWDHGARFVCTWRLPGASNSEQMFFDTSAPPSLLHYHIPIQILGNWLGNIFHL